MVGCTGRVGVAGDNSAMESFFAPLQKNVLNRRGGDTHEQLRMAIVTRIERTYHRRWRQAHPRAVDPSRIRSIRDHTGPSGGRPKTVT